MKFSGPIRPIKNNFPPPPSPPSPPPSPKKFSPAIRCPSQYEFLVILPPHMIPFWNPWDVGSTLEGFTGLLVNIRKMRKVKNIVPKF